MTAAELCCRKRKANAAKENMGALCKKPLGKQLRGQFFYKKYSDFLPCGVCSFGSRLAESDSLVDNSTADGHGSGRVRGVKLSHFAFDKRGLCSALCGAFPIELCVAAPFLERAMRQYKDFAFKKLIGKEHFVFS